jgi:hypothetical protein
MIATTTCNFSNPVLFDGSVPSSTSDIFNFASSSCVEETASSTDQLFSGGFSYGEIVISVFLLISCVALLYAFLYFSILGIKIKSDL